MKKNFIILILTFCLIGSLFSQEKILYHKFSSTASSWQINEWNTSDTLNYFRILKETVDSQGRVSELEFITNNSVLCYLATKIKYTYKNDSIIEELFQFDEVPTAGECELPYKRIYHLNNNYIEKVENFYTFDTLNLSESEINQIKKNTPEYSIYNCTDSINTEIEYYYFSFAKLKGLYPINKGYKFKTGNYYYDKEPVNELIIKGIEKVKNNR